MADDALEKVKAFLAKVNGTYGGTVAEFGGKFGALKLARFSSGILPLDLALGGGWPYSRVVTIAGEYSTGKTLLCLKACAEVMNYDHVTRQHKAACELHKQPFTAGRAFFVDVEGAFDPEWAKANGFDDTHHVVARPSSAEQTIDMVSSAIEDDVFDLIIVDSIAAMTPSKEIEESSEDWQMGLAARLNNKAYRRWNSMLNTMSQKKTAGGPLLICLNQFRMKIGMVMGDPRTLPGGKGQEFCSSIIIYTKSGEYDDKSDSLSEVALKGVVHKNKTFLPKKNYEFTLALKDNPEKAIKKGDIDNVSELMSYGKKFGLITTSGKDTVFNKESYPTQKALASKLAVSPSLYRTLWRSILAAATGYR